MSRIYSLEQVPELAGLSKGERRVILLYYLANQAAAPGAGLKEALLVGSIIVAQVGGFMLGAIVSGSTFWGPLGGSVTTLMLVMLAFYFGNLRSEISTFRRFLQAGHSQLLLQQMGKFRADEGARALPAAQDALDLLRQRGTNAAVEGSSGRAAEALKRVSLDTARSSEIMELSQELATQSLEFFNSSKHKQEEAWRVLRWLRLGTFLRLNRESATLQAEAFRLLRRSGDLLHGAETTLGTAAALLADVKKRSENGG